MQADGGACEDGVVFEGVLPRDGAGRLLVPFRPGDVLRVSAPFVETVATSVTRSEAILRWPWRRNDPLSNYDWTRAEFGFPFKERALLHLLWGRGQADCHMRTRRPRPPAIARSAFAGFCFPADVIVLAVRWYLRFGLSYRDVEELLAERGVEVDHVTVYRWVQRFTPLLAEAARPCRHAVGTRWQVDETYVKVAGQWRYVYRAIDEFGQVIDVFVSERRDAKSARCFFERAIATTAIIPVEVVTDQAAAYPTVLDELVPAAWHRTDQYANNRVEADHGCLKARLRPMRGLKQDRSARVVITGHALVQNIRRAHYELAVEEPLTLRLAVAFDELALAI